MNGRFSTFGWPSLRKRCHETTFRNGLTAFAASVLPDGPAPLHRHLIEHAGTCRIDDRMAVVDPACRVYGIDGLRVVDGSVMPALVCANTNIPFIDCREGGRPDQGVVAIGEQGLSA